MARPGAGLCGDQFVYSGPDGHDHRVQCTRSESHSDDHASVGWGGVPVSWGERVAVDVMGMHRHQFTGDPPTCGCGKSAHTQSVSRAPASQCVCEFTVLGGELFPSKVTCQNFFSKYGVIPCDPTK